MTALLQSINKTSGPMPNQIPNSPR